MQFDASELILIRHAPADHGGALCGRRDVPVLPLDPVRIAGLQLLLAGCGTVVASPALRCRQTATALFATPPERTDARLWEQDFGAHDGLAFDALPDLGPLSSAALAAHCPPGGESFNDMARRVWPVLDDLASGNSDDGPTALVVHAGTVRAALAWALGATDPACAAALAFEVAPLSITRLRCQSGGVSVICTNWAPVAP